MPHKSPEELAPKRKLNRGTKPVFKKKSQEILKSVFWWGVLSPIFLKSNFVLESELLLLCIFNGLLIFFVFKKYSLETENTPAEIIDKSPLDECPREKNRLQWRERYIDNILTHPLVEQIKERKLNKLLLSDKYSKEELEKLAKSWPRDCSNEELKRIQNALSKKLRKRNRRTTPIREKKSHVILKSIFVCEFCGSINNNPEDFYCKGCGKYNYGKDKSLLASNAMSAEEISCINCSFTQQKSATELCSNCGLNIYEKVEYQTCTNCGSEFQTGLSNCPICGSA